MAKIDELKSSSNDPKTYYAEHEQLYNDFSHYWERFANKETLDRFIIPLYRFKNYEQAKSCISQLDNISPTSFFTSRTNLDNFWLAKPESLDLNAIVASTMKVHWSHI